MNFKNGSEVKIVSVFTNIQYLFPMAFMLATIFSALRRCIKTCIVFALSATIIWHCFHFIQLMLKENSYNSKKTFTPECEKETEGFNSSNLPWYFKNGQTRPMPKNYSCIWPDETRGDRVINQLMYLPKEPPLKIKTIYAEEASYLQKKTEIFKNCPVNACAFTKHKNQADAVIHQHRSYDVRNSSVPLNQVWIFYSEESPFLSGLSKYVNWTMTYRTDSDIVLPYGKWIYYNESVKTKKQDKNYAKGKTKKVAWFVSNCSPSNNRYQYATELQKYIDVDIYGKCGQLNCPRYAECMKLLRKHYKFYLAFENCNCRDYITEKFFYNSLRHDVLPIVMGAHPDDYEKVAPYESYIHVDYFSSPKELADYLHILDKNDTLYNSYFEWKGTGELIDHHFYCRLCALLHSDRKSRTYDDFPKWWNHLGNCKLKPWRWGRFFWDN